MKKENTNWYIILILTMAIWGTQHPALKVLSGKVNPSLFNSLRFFIAILVLLPFVVKNRIKIEKKNLGKILFLGVIGISLFGMLNIIGINLSTAINNSILINSWPLMLVVLAPLLIKEKISKKALLGVFVGFVGVIIILTNGKGILDIIKSKFFIGNLIILLSALCTAIYAMYNKKYIKKYGGLEITFWSVVSGFLLLFIYSLASGDFFEITNISFNSFLLILHVAVFTTALAWVVRFKSIDKIGLIQTSAFMFLVPIAGILSSNLFLGEQITIFTLIGAFFILSGIYLAQKI
ncbi:MAG: DMT family transporter [bacterium]